MKLIGNKLLGTLAALMLVVNLLAVSLPVMAAIYPLSATSPQITAALNFIRNSESEHPTLWTGGEKTCYAIVAIEACGGDPHDFKNSQGKSMVDIIRENVGTYCKPQASASLAHEYYLFAIAAAGENPWNFGGVNVAGQLLSMFNGEQFGQTGIINDDFWAIITLIGAGVDPSLPAIQTAKDFIIAHQNADGGWGSSISGGGMAAGGDPCDTANAIMALIAAGESSSSSAIQNAFAYIKNLQNDDGGFPYVEGANSDSGTDARVIAAIRAAGGDPTSAEWTVNGNNPFYHALSQQNDDGGFAWTAGGSTDAWMTTYIMPALVGKYWPTVVLSEMPSIGVVSPEQGAVVHIARPQISASYTDTAAGIDSIVLKIDTADVTAQSDGSVISYTPAANLSEGGHTVQLTLSDRAGKTATRTWTFTVDADFSGDTVPPQVDSVSPADGAAVATLRPQISANYSDASSGIDTSRVILRVNGADVTAAASVGASGITYQPGADLVAGTVEARLSLWDNAGNVRHFTWDFTVSSGSGSQPTATSAVIPTATISPVITSSGLTGKIDGSGVVTSDVTLQTSGTVKRLTIRQGTVVVNGSGHPAENVTITSEDYSPEVDSDYCRIGTACELGPSGTTFSQPAILTFYYEESSSQDSIRWDTNGDGNVDFLDKDIAVTPEDFRIAYYDTSAAAWVFLESTVDKVNKMVTTEVMHFSLFVLAAPATEPLIAKDIAISPSTVNLGEDVTIIVTVENPGEHRGTYIVPLYIDDFYEDNLEAIVDPGEHEISFTHREPYTGEHEAEVLGATTTFTVNQVAASSGDTTDTGSNWWDSVDIAFYIYIIIGVLCIIVIVGGILLARMRKPKAGRRR